MQPLDIQEQKACFSGHNGEGTEAGKAQQQPEAAWQTQMRNPTKNKTRGRLLTKQQIGI